MVSFLGCRLFASRNRKGFDGCRTLKGSQDRWKRLVGRKSKHIKMRVIVAGRYMNHESLSKRGLHLDSSCIRISRRRTVDSSGG